VTEAVTIGPATLYLGDCRDVLPTLAGVDAVVTDPPYGINWKPRVNHADQPWKDDETFDPSPWLNVGKWHCFWGANYFADRLPPSPSWLTWVKRPIHSDVNFSGDPRSYATTELAWCDYGKNRFKVLVWDGGKRAGDKENRTFCHPSQKPLELMTWCLPPEAENVLDPYMGSGTTGVACVRMGKAFVGVEREPEYFAVACDRIRRAVSESRSLLPLEVA
jgi:site-specific DNA-methyltransferase (adenine-specific)